MTKVRQDAWSHEDDLLLAETVLRHIREGSTQLNAFEEVGDELNRTSAACGFRWNAEVRNNYVDAIELAKRQRKDKKRHEEGRLKKRNKRPKQPHPIEPSSQVSPAVGEISLDMVITYLQSLQDNIHDTAYSQQQISKLQEENSRLKEKTIALDSELSLTNKKLKTIEEDYKTFIQIMDRARKMTVLDDQGTRTAPMFRMDKNGNLRSYIQDQT